MAVITCPHCGTDVDLGDGRARSGHSQASGEARKWVWERDGEVVHTCTESEESEGSPP